MLCYTPRSPEQQERDMPKHEPEVIAAVRRRKPVNSRVVLNDRFPGAALNRQLLCCPRCEYQYLHSGASYNCRDGKEYTRRISFSCESCGDAAEFELVITDHKGNVFVEWRECPQDGDWP
jgi:hypothetical protein